MTREGERMEPEVVNDGVATAAEPTCFVATNVRFQPPRSIALSARWPLDDNIQFILL